jgi:hypothetical protein
MGFRMFTNVRGLIFCLTVFIGLSFVFPPAGADAQRRRDHLTDQEIEIVRDVQEIDYRMLVFIKAIERRLVVLEGVDNLSADQVKKIDKEEDKWGELPEGTQTELLSDIDKILDEAINKIEDVAERDVESDLFPIAVYILSESAKNIIPRIEKFAENNENARDIALINSAVRQCSDIIEASSKVPRPDEKQLKKRLKKI